MGNQISFISFGESMNTMTLKYKTLYKSIMKRVLFLLVAFAFSLYSIAQYRFDEVVVKAPKYIGPIAGIENTKDIVNPISKFLQKDLSSKAQLDYLEFQEGTVVIDFTVTTDGYVKNLIVRNSVSNINDYEVIESLKSTSGKWMPGLKDGDAVEMEKRVVIAFSDENSPTLQKQAIYYSNRGIRKFYKAEQCETNIFLNEDVKMRRAERKYNTALNKFNHAEKLRPGQAQVIFWQAKTYEKLGDDFMRDLKLLEFDEAVQSSQLATGDVVRIYF